MDFTSPPLSLQDNGFSMVTIDPAGTPLEEVEKLKEELRIWKTRVEDAVKVKAELAASKSRAEKRLTELLEQEKQRRDRTTSSEQELLMLKQENTELTKKIEKLKEDLQEHTSQDNLLEIKKKVAEMQLKFSHLEEMSGADVDMDTHCVFELEIKKKVAEMQLKFSHLEGMKDDGADVDVDTHCVFEIKKKVAEMQLKFTHLEEMSGADVDMDTHCVFELEIKKKVAEMQLKFSHLEEVKDDGADVDMDTHCVFEVATKAPFKLNQNQALLTFEEEEVAQKLTKMSKHFVNLESRTACVTVKPFEFDMGFQFELRVTVSGKKINVSDIPELPIPEDWMRDKLELHFYKTEQARGGGEIEEVTYNKGCGTGVITFLQPGASYNFVGCTEYNFCAEGRCFTLSVSPHFGFHLDKFQPHCRVSKKTIVLTGVPEVEEDEESVQDMIEIHFQKPSNGGGEIEKIKYISRGAAYVCFEEDTGNASSESTGDS